MTQHDGMPGAGLTTRPLRLSRFLQMEAMDERSATLFLSHDGARVRIPAALHVLLMRFEVPQSIDSLVAGHPQADKVAQALIGLRAKGFLHDAATVQDAGPGRLLTDPPQRMFDVPAFKPGSTHADVVMVGVPSDSADRDCAGARAAPLALREVSLHLLYSVDARSGRARGWYDADAHRPLLQGVAMADAGDIVVDPGEDQQRLFDRLEQVLARMGGALPVLIGGDSTACWPLLARRSAADAVYVIRIGGPAPRVPANGRVVSSATLLARALQLDGVTDTLQIAPSSSAGDAGDWAHPRHRLVSAQALQASGPERLLQALPEGQRVHLGLDLAVLGHPGQDAAPGHMSCQSVAELVRAIGTRCRITGLDLTGLVPARAGWNVAAATALQLLVLALDAACGEAGAIGEQHAA